MNHWRNHFQAKNYSVTHSLHRLKFKQCMRITPRNSKQVFSFSRAVSSELPKNRMQLNNNNHWRAKAAAWILSNRKGAFYKTAINLIMESVYLIMCTIADWMHAIQSGMVAFIRSMSIRTFSAITVLCIVQRWIWHVR